MKPIHHRDAKLINKKTRIGWREWVSLPDFKVVKIKGKIDTGAKTSSLHAEKIEFFKSHGKDHVRFTIYPLQKNHRQAKTVSALVLDHRHVRSSNGSSELRPVIQTQLKMGKRMLTIEVTLTNRDLMGFRLLIGRDALKSFVIYPARSFLLTKKKKKPKNLT